MINLIKPIQKYNESLKYLVPMFDSAEVDPGAIGLSMPVIFFGRAIGRPSPGTENRQMLEARHCRSTSDSSSPEKFRKK